MDEVFFKGFYIRPVRHQGDHSIVSRIVGYAAWHPRGWRLPVCKTKREVKSAILSFNNTKRTS